MLPKKINTICFVLPEYRKDTPTHFRYAYDLLREASKLMDICLYVERADGGADWNAEFPGLKKIFVARTKNIFFRFWESMRIVYLLRRSGVADFYVHYSFGSAFAASLVVKLLGGRVFYWNCGEPWKYRRNFLRDWFERIVYHMIDYLVTGTESLKEKYASAYGIAKEKIKVMPNWIDAQKFKNQISKLNTDELRAYLNIRNGTKVLLFVHRLSRRKGAQYLLEIITKFKDKNVVLVIIGDGPEKENLELKIRNMGLRDKARILGSVPNAIIASYYALADVFLMPSDEEGFPRVLLEAMAAGIPFVAFDVGGVREIVPPECGEFVVGAGDTERFAEKIKTLLLSDSAGKDALRRVEQEWVLQFDLKEVAHRFQELFL